MLYKTSNNYVINIENSMDRSYCMRLYSRYMLSAYFVVLTLLLLYNILTERTYLKRQFKARSSNERQLFRGIITERNATPGKIPTDVGNINLDQSSVLKDDTVFIKDLKTEVKQTFDTNYRNRQSINLSKNTHHLTNEKSLSSVKVDGSLFTNITTIKQTFKAQNEQNVNISMPYIGKMKTHLKTHREKVIHHPNQSQSYNLTIKTMAQLNSTLKSIADETNTIMISYVEFGYIDFAINLYVTSTERFQIQNYLFISSDTKSCSILSARNINCLHYFNGVLEQGIASDFRTKGFLMKSHLKIKLVLDALELGFNLILVDLDIVFLKNPLPYLKENIQDLDILIQDNTNECNTGFYYIKPTNSSLLLFEKAWEIADTPLGQKQDDQRIIADLRKHLLFKQNLKSSS